MNLLSIFFFTAVTLVLGIESTYAEPFKNEFTGYIIKPASALDWTSPRSLAITSVKSALSSEYAPIGHFATEIKCDKPNKFGISHVRTGMETYGDNNTRELTLKKKLGLGTLYYQFPGDLQSADYVTDLIAKAKKDGRLVVVKIPTTSERCQKALEFIEGWIDHGSYTIYGANKNVQAGEGSGCADFALEFFLIATSIFPRDALLAKVWVPERLIGDGVNKRVPFRKVLAAKKWAKNEIDGKPLMIMDTDKTTNFLYHISQTKNTSYTYVKHLIPESTIFTDEQVIAHKEKILGNLVNLPAYEIEDYNFTFQYPQRESSKATWDRITVK